MEAAAAPALRVPGADDGTTQHRRRQRQLRHQTPLIGGCAGRAAPGGVPVPAGRRCRRCAIWLAATSSSLSSRVRSSTLRCQRPAGARASGGGGGARAASSSSVAAAKTSPHRPRLAGGGAAGGGAAPWPGVDVTAATRLDPAAPAGGSAASAPRGSAVRRHTVATAAVAFHPAQFARAGGEPAVAAVWRRRCGQRSDRLANPPAPIFPASGLLP